MSPIGDNSFQDGTDPIATDEITGGVADGVKVARSKTGYGVDGEYYDVSFEAGLPIRGDSKTVSGTADTDGDILFSVDTLGYRSVGYWVLFPDDPASSEIAIESSADNTNWTDMPSFFNPGLVDLVRPSFSMSGFADVYQTGVGVLPHRYLRARASIGDGPRATNMTIMAQLYAHPLSYPFLPGAGVSYGDGNEVADYLGLPIANAREGPYTGSSAVADDDLIESRQVAMHRSYALELDGDGDGHVEVQITNGGVNYYPAIAYAADDVTGTPVTALSPSNMYYGSTFASSLRVRSVGQTTGTINASLTLFSQPIPR